MKLSSVLSEFTDLLKALSDIGLVAVGKSGKLFFIRIKIMDSLKKFLFIVAFSFSALLSNAQFDIQHYLIEGHRDLMNSNYTTAIQRFNTIIQIKPDLLEAYYYRGYAKYSLSDYQGAYTDFHKVIELNPYFSEGYRFRGITKAAMQDYQDAMEDFNKAIRLDLTNPDNYVSRGFTLLLMKEFDRSIADFNQALKINKELPYAYLQRGYAKLSKQDFDGAIKDFTEGIKLNPYSPDGFARRAIALAEQKKFNEALVDLNRAIEMDENNTLYYFQRAFIKYNNKDLEGTMQDYNKVLELNPENALTFFNRAILKAEIGDNQGAINDYTQAAELHPKNILPYFNRGGVKYEMKDYYGAIQDWSQAIEIFPDFAKAYQARSSARYLVGDIIGAMDDKETAKKKIDQYQAKNHEDSAMAQYMDTSYNFKKIIEFDSDFYRANMDDGQIQNRRIVINLKPILVITEKQEGMPVENFTFYLKNLEKLNRNNPLKTTFTVSSQLSKMDVDTVRSLLNATEQEKLRSSFNAYLYFYQGLLNSTIQNFNQSIKAYSAAIGLEPSFDLAYFNRANTRYLMVEYINSMEDYSQVITLEGQSTSVREEKSMNQEFTDYQEVISDLDKAIELNPDFGFAYYNRGNVKCMTKDFTGAINDYTNAIAVGPEMPQAYYNRGLTLIYLQDSEKGCLDMSKAGELGLEDAYPVIKKYCSKEK